MPVLNLPDYFEWATDANRTESPATASIDTGLGWDYSDRPPPKVMNYIHELQEQWAQRAVGMAISNWTGQADIFTGAAASVDIVVKDVSLGKWVVIEPAGGPTFSSYDGVAWTAGAVLGAAANYNTRINTTVDGVVVGTAAGIGYSTDAGATWTLRADGATTDLANNGVATLFLGTSNVGVLNRYTFGAAGGPVAPSSVSWGAANLLSVCKLDTANKYAVLAATSPHTIHLSTDDGDNWTQAAEAPPDAVSGMVVSRIRQDDGTMVAVGADGGGIGVAAYSTDDSATWSASTFHVYAVPDALSAVEPCGNKCWVAIGDGGGGHTNRIFNLWFSIDDGVNFYPANIFCDPAMVTNEVTLRDIWCDGASLIAVGTEAAIIKSLMIGLI